MSDRVEAPWANELRRAGFRDERVISAMDLPRDIFAPKGFGAWNSSALPIGHGQTISHPLTVAQMTSLLIERNPKKVLEIGTGSGFQAAVLSRLCDEVCTVERIQALQSEAIFRFNRLDAQVTADLMEHEAKLDSAAFVRYRYKKLMELDSVKLALIQQYPDMFLSKMMMADKEVVPPIVNERGDTLTMDQRRQYYLEHYFDNIPLEENAIIRTPKAIFYDNVMNFYDNVLNFTPPQVIIQYMDPMLERAKKAPDVFQYLVMTLTQKYLQSNVMIYDEVYVHLVKKYYASGDNFWSSPSSIDKEVARANKWERLLVGREAPELILFDTLHIPHSLHAFPHKWKLLVFWSPNCGHCKHIIPAVYKVFEKYTMEYDIGAFTIMSDPDDKTRLEWKKFMVEHGMPSAANRPEAASRRSNKK